MKILLYGGTFNPVHYAHVYNIELALEQNDYDKVIIIPNNGGHYKDNLQLASINDRLIMLDIAFKDKLDFLEISDIELNGIPNKPHYTLDTVLEIKKTYKDASLYFLIGSDQAEILDKWHGIDQLKQLVTFIVTTRDENAKFADDLLVIHNKPLPYSSTAIRENYATSGIDEIDAYIRYYGLYLETILTKYLSSSRATHSKNVATLCKKYAKQYNIDENKAYVAGMLHDIAKELPRDTQKELALKQPIHFELSKPTYHGAAAIEIITKDLHIYDQEILEAIRWHTTAYFKMSPLDKLLYTSDMVSAERNYEGVEHLRHLLATNLDQAFKEGFMMSYQFLIDKNVEISDDLKKLKKEIEGDNV